MAAFERYVDTDGTISIGTGDSVVTGAGTLFGSHDREASAVYAVQPSGALVLVGIVAAVDPRGEYDNLSLPLVAPYNGAPIANSPYLIVDGPAISSGTTQAAIFARFSGFLDQNMGLAGNRADDIDWSLVPNNTLFVDGEAKQLLQWRNGELEPVLSASGGSGDVVGPDGAQDGDLAVFDGDTGKLLRSGGAPVVASQIRERLLGPRTYYVRVDGDDDNDGRADDASRSFRTINRAIAEVYSIDLGVHGVTIQLGDGTYNEGLHFNAPFLGSGAVRLTGNPVTPANVVVTAATTISVYAGAIVRLNNLEIRASSIGLSVRSGGVCYLEDGVRFAACTNYHIESNFGGNLVGANYSIVGNAARHIRLAGGMCQYAANAITLEGPLSIPVFIEAVGVSYGSFYATTWTGGAVTGKRYQVSGNSVLQVYGGGPNVFPGSTAGDTATGGQYI